MKSATTHSAAAPHPVVKGRTVIQAQALESVAAYATAEILGVNPKRVDVSVHDDNTMLGLSVHTPLLTTDIERCQTADGVTVFSLCDQAREKISDRTAAITGHTIGEIHLIINGVQKAAQKRRILA